MNDVNKFMYDWNPKSNSFLLKTRIEDDSLRDGLQGAFVRKPTIKEKIELVQLSAEVGVQSLMLGFPAISPQELAECRTLLEYIQSKNLKTDAIFLARAHIDDLKAIVELHKNVSSSAEAAIYLGTSPLRRYIEKWDLKDMLKKCETACDYMANQNVRFGFSVEDATRTPPEDLLSIIRITSQANAATIDICDTAGASTPEGAFKLVSFVKEQIEKLGSSMKITWHGHNDRGLGVANSIAAAQAGASGISGSFLGIGERTGNAPLEQIAMYLHQAGNRLYTLDKISPYCMALAKYTNTEIRPEAPIVGSQAFATCTGTHAAAVLKARKHGIDFEDYIFSGVPASKLGRKQEILIGPTSGMAVSYYVIEQLGLPSTEDNAYALLEYAKTQSQLLSNKDIQLFFANKETLQTA